MWVHIIGSFCAAYHWVPTGDKMGTSLGTIAPQKFTVIIITLSFLVQTVSAQNELAAPRHHDNCCCCLFFLQFWAESDAQDDASVVVSSAAGNCSLVFLDLVLTPPRERASNVPYNKEFSNHHHLLWLSTHAAFYSHRTQQKQILNYRKADFNLISCRIEHFSKLFVCHFSSRSVTKTRVCSKKKQQNLSTITFQKQLVLSTYLNLGVANHFEHQKNKKKIAFSQLRSDHSQVTRKDNVKCVKLYHHAIQNAKHMFLSQDLHPLIKNSLEKFYHARSRTSGNIILLNQNGCPITQESYPAMFNNYFTSVFTKKTITTCTNEKK